MSQIIGDAELKRKLQRLSDLSFLRRQMTVIGKHVKGKVSKYPEAPAKIKEPGHTWYDRGWGSRWMRADGSIGGRQTSEDLGQSWTSKVTGDTRVELGNDTSYGKWVQDPSSQARRMKAIGWKTTQQVVEEEEQKVLDYVKKAVDRELAR